MERSDLGAIVPAEYLELIASDRVSARTREVLEARLRVPASVNPVLNDQQIVTLRAMLGRVVPQKGSALDLTACILEQLDTGKGDGWRYDVLPDDRNAYREGLDRLAASGFAEADTETQDNLLKALATGDIVAARWFEEVRGDATVAYIAHPAMLARLGYSGIGVGGAETKHQGFVTLGPNQREDWEPLPAVEEGR